MKLVTLNLRHGGGRRMPQLADRLAGYGADLLLLTEFRENAAAATLRTTLAASGLTHQAATPQQPRLNGLFAASRHPFRIVKRRALRLDPLRLLALELDAFSLVGVHLPNLMAKLPHWEALLRLARARSRKPLVFLGDFNTGRIAGDAQGGPFPFSGAPYMEALEKMAWVDAWRHFHPRGREYTWYSHRGRGFRLDHAFLSPRCAPFLCSARFDHAIRTEGLTDHSALMVELEL